MLKEVIPSNQSLIVEALYGHPDNVELYPGLMAEEAKKTFSPASGLCPGFTISEAILSDAVTLVRGDRFYSVEYGPQSLTNFGYVDRQPVRKTAPWSLNAHIS